MTQGYSKSKPQQRNRFQKAFFHTFVFIFLVLITTGGYLRFVGFPDWVLRAAAKKMQDSAYSIDSSVVRLGRYGYIVMDDVRVYRKGAIGPAVADVERITFKIDPLGMKRKGRLIRRVKVRGGVLRPRMFFRGPSSQKERGEVDMDFRFGLDLEDCTVWGLKVGDMSGEVVCDGEVMFLKWDDASLLSQSLEGAFKGEARFSFDDSQLGINMDAEFDPHLLIPLLTEVNLHVLVKLINRFEFLDTVPRFKVDVSKKIEKGTSLEVNGNAWLQNVKYRGVRVHKADGTVNVFLSPDVATVTVDPLVLIRKGEGAAEVGLALDMKKKTIEFRGDSKMDPVAVARMTGVFSAKFLDRFKFEDDVSINAKGVIGYKDMALTKITGTGRAKKAHFEKFPVEDAVVDVKVSGITNTIVIKKGKMFGGDLTSTIVAVKPHKRLSPPGLTNSVFLKWDLEGADFDSLMSSDLCGNQEKKFKGVLETRGLLSGLLDPEKREALKGEGVIKVRDGRVFMMPIFGGLSRYMTKIIPGLDFVLRQSDADLEFKLENDKLILEELTVEGTVLSLAGDGSCTLDKELDADIKVTLMKEHTLVGKLLQLLTYPVSKLFEFRLTGTIDDPEWYLENFSKDLLEKLGLTRKKKRSKEIEVEFSE